MVEQATPERRALRDSARRFLAQQCDFARHRRQQRPDADFDRALWRRFGEMGWLGAMVAEDAGGLGQSALEALAVVEAMGGQFVAEPYAQALAAAQLLQTLGDAAQRQRWLPGLCDGSLLILPAHAEPGSGHALDCVATRAVRVASGWRLDGLKCAVPCGAAADWLLISARIDAAPEGLSLFAVERGAAGLNIEADAGIAGEALAELRLEAVEVPAQALLGRAGGACAAIEAAHDLVLAAACAEAAGTLEAVLQASCDYARTRQQFGVPLASFQVIAHRLVDMYTQGQLARSMAALAAQCLIDETPAAQRRLRLSAAKAQVSAACQFVGEQAIQIHGGIGMTDELALSHQVRRLLAIDLRLGDRFHHLGVLSAAVMAGASLYA